MTDKEKYYDEHIAPLLAQAGKLCEENEMSMVCAVEFNPDEIGETTVLQEDCGLNMTMTHLCLRTAPNIDSFMINLIQYCDMNDIDYTSSIYIGGLS